MIKILNFQNFQSLIREPWGRPGPGGIPWRNPRSVGNKFLKSLGWTDKNDLNHLDYNSITWQGNPIENIPEEPEFEKPEQPVRDRNFKSSPTIADTSDKMCCSKCACVCLNEILSKEKILARDEFGGSAKSLREIKEESTKPSKKSNSHPQSKTKHKNTNCIIEPKPRPCMITAGVELVPLLARRKALQRPISLSTTDVTRHKDQQSDWQDVNAQYLTELNRQMARRDRDTQLRKEFDRATSQQHFETWDTFWGRPGYGAPKEVKNKLNLDQLLFRSHKK